MLPNSAETTAEMRLDQGGLLRKLNDAVTSARQNLELIDKSHPLRSESLDNLADAVSTRFLEGGERSDLDEAILLYRQTLELRPSPDPLRPDSLNNLSKVLLKRFQQGGQPSDLDEALSLPKQALELQPLSHPFRSSSLDNIAFALFRKFEITGQRGDLDESISLHQQALELRAPPHPLRSDSLNNLANALFAKFRQEGHKTDLNEAISLHRQALELRPSPHPGQANSLSNLAYILCTRFQKEGHQTDLNEAILLHRQAVELEPSNAPGRPTTLNNLANALFTRFEQEGDQRDLNEALLLHRQTLELRTSPNPDRSKSLNNIALMLWTRFEQEGRQTDLDEAILLHSQALELRPPPHPLRSMSLNNLAGAVHTRFQQGGDRNDLDDAILLLRQALELRVSPHPDRSMALNNLAFVLWTRFGQDSLQIDLDEAISLHRKALELRIPPHPLRSTSLHNLALALWRKYDITGQKNDLNESISLHQHALELRDPPHPQRSESLNSLANALQTRFEQEGLQTDLSKAISLHREALDLRILSHPLRSESLNNLANALRTKFEQEFEGHQSELNEAISLYRQALELRPSPHPNQSQSFAHSLAGKNSGYLDEATGSFCAATQCINQPASLRLRIAHTWIKQAILHKHMSVIDAYDAALQALPKLAALSFDVRARQEALLTDTDGLARDASRFAIQAGKRDKAIEFLEVGRAIFWTQFLSLRSPLEQLHDIAPELAVKLRDTATALELGSHRNRLADASENQKKLIIDQETTRLNRLNAEWLKAIEDVRQLNGFENFLRPRSLSALQVAASEGPVVLLIGNDDGSDILILTSANVQNIRLSGLATGELQNLVHLLQAASSDSKIWLSHFKDRSGNTSRFPLAIVETLRNWIKLEEERGMRYQDQIQISSDDVFRFVLEKLWKEVVKPIIDILNLEKSEEPPVVQWCPTGLFSFLPIHAAGCYDGSLAIECASDYLISSYTPTIGALLTQDRAPTTEPFKMMVVVQSRDLPCTRKELEKIEQHVSNDFLIKLGIPGTSASVEAVASRLSDVAIVHFSCHGTQDRLSPLDSGLRLEDGLLRVSRIMKENIPTGALAFLCACETAMGDDKLPDEAMSLGASLLFSGFRRVVATMWAMIDEDGPVIADAFYEELFRGPDGRPTREPDASKSALALHIAVKKLRSKKVSFRRWVPFIHMGK